MDNDRIDRIAKGLTAGVSEDDVWELYRKSGYSYSNIAQGIWYAIEQHIHDMRQDHGDGFLEESHLEDVMKIFKDAEKKLNRKDKILKSLA